ncbi:serine/threonine protein kinase [Mycolicibacter heraklionensis]|uniref:non-specific serine/threonine protein kinase n=1 Tax=Mycolicibacter heraklionensis TaxID=512402 RepID=A0AA91EY91_9MYCO|nr:serine/threonine-protein kinase [Mycolicibacter heraklionensis]OBK89169.1 serine/threonine protein kinase [Mycolicibacter heraklionensis]
MALASGSIFAEYTILKLVGAGGMGKVYLAQHPRLPRREALKILRRSLSADDEYEERFRREAEAAAVLVHPNIVRVHDRGEYRGRLWLSMEYIEGETLGELITRKFPAGMPAQIVIPIVASIADALDYAHGQGVVHRDVKPSNILVTEDGDEVLTAVLADFGVARQLSGPTGLTASNLAIGTVAYAAPEQLMGAEGLECADQYALAATTFQMLTGMPPYQHENPVTVISHHLNTPPPLLSDRRPELQQFDDVLAAALAKDPAERFRDCSDFVAALAEQLADPDSDDKSDSASTVVRGVPRALPAPPPSRLSKLARPAILVPLGLAVVGSVAAIVPRLLAEEPTDTASVTASTAPAEVVAPPPKAPAFEGTYRVDANRAGEKYNGVPNPQPPNVSTWWAVKSSCDTSECTASAIMLDSKDHRKAATTPSGGNELALEYTGDSWRSQPQTLQAPCIAVDGRQGSQITTQVLTLEPTIPGVLHGAMVATVESNECGQRGAQIWVPVVASRFGDLPAGINPSVEMVKPAKPA